MQNLNQVQLIGFVGSDPKSKKINETFNTSSFSIATSEDWKNKAGEKQESTQWHNIEAVNAKADLVDKLIKKGALVHITGKITYDKFVPQGQTDEVTITKIILSDFILLDRRPVDQK